MEHTSPQCSWLEKKMLYANDSKFACHYVIRKYPFEFMFCVFLQTHIYFSHCKSLLSFISWFVYDSFVPPDLKGYKRCLTFCKRYLVWNKLFKRLNRCYSRNVLRSLPEYQVEMCWKPLDRWKWSERLESTWFLSVNWPKDQPTWREHRLPEI